MTLHNHVNYGPRKIAIFNQKGGVSKSTTALCLAVSIANRDKKVLIVEKDQQANIRKVAGIEVQEGVTETLYELLHKEQKNADYNPMDAVVVNAIDGVDIMVTGPNFAEIDTEMVAKVGMVNAFKTLLEHDALSHYDYIIVDNPSHLGIVTMSSLTAVDKVVIPFDTTRWAFEGVDALLRTFTHVKRKFNKKLDIAGVFLVKVAENDSDRPKMIRKCTDIFGKYYIKSYVNYCKGFEHALKEDKTIYSYKSRQSGMQTNIERARRQYDSITSEIIKSFEGSEV